jgi:beta-glucosidase
VYRRDRITYLRNGMMWQQSAIAESVPIRASSTGAPMDDFEWINGYGNRLGLVYVDVRRRRASTKLSAQWFCEAAARSAVV